MDRQAACAAENPATQAQIATWWRDYFAALPAGSRILDIATGNGAVLVHAAEAEALRAVKFELSGVDLADIDPPRYLSALPRALHDATFLGGVAAEDLPFDAGRFDCVVSQYGLEYANIERALAEAARVLGPGGCLRWLAHCEDSDVAQQNSDQDRQVDLLLSPEGPVRAMERLIGRIRRGTGLEEATKELASALNLADRFCNAYPPAKIVQEVCCGLADVARRWQAFYLRDLDAMMRDTRQKLLEHRLRIEDLRAAVLTSERQRRVRGILDQEPWQSPNISRLRVGLTQGSIGLVIEARVNRVDGAPEKKRKTVEAPKSVSDAREHVPHDRESSDPQAAVDRAPPGRHPRF